MRVQPSRHLCLNLAMECMKDVGDDFSNDDVGPNPHPVLLELAGERAEVRRIPDHIGSCVIYSLEPQRINGRTARVGLAQPGLDVIYAFQRCVAAERLFK